METSRDYIVRTWGRATVAQQAAALHLSASYVRRLRSELLRAGAVSAQRRKANPLWPADTLRRVRAGLRAGRSITDIARDFRRDADGLLAHCNANGLHVSAERVGHVWQALDIAHMFDVQEKRVRQWRAALGAKTRAQGHWRITRAQLLAFVAKREYWPAYTPDAIRDPDIRAAARFERLRAGGDWEPIMAWAYRHGWAPSTARRWCANGTIPNALRTTAGWFVWKETV